MGMNVKEKSDVMGKDEAMLTNMLLHSGYIETVLLMKTTSPLSMVLCCTMVFVLGIIQEGLHFPRQWILPCFRGAFTIANRLGTLGLDLGVPGAGHPLLLLHDGVHDPQHLAVPGCGAGPYRGVPTLQTD